ncbi:MAG: hypothetical protein WC783_03000 [Candidatus Paceibacterota bacterium]|jgi:hypothetical protein
MESSSNAFSIFLVLILLVVLGITIGIVIHDKNDLRYYADYELKSKQYGECTYEEPNRVFTEDSDDGIPLPVLYYYFY